MTDKTKPIVDCFFALILIVPAILICVPIGLIYWFKEKENPLFSQERLGKDQNIFVLYKMRSMKKSATNSATHLQSNSNVTRMGAFLRKWKIDELPQIVNVLKGDMSFVGPRPGLANQIELANERKKRDIFSIKPGITGLSQVRDLDMSNPSKLAIVDEIYMNNRSLFFDLKILILTLTGKGRGDRIRPS